MKVPDHIYRIIKSQAPRIRVKDAIQNAVGRASRTLRQVGWFEVLDMTRMALVLMIMSTAMSGSIFAETLAQLNPGVQDLAQGIQPPKTEIPHATTGKPQLQAKPHPPLTFLKCSIDPDPQNSYSYILYNANTYTIPSQTKVTIAAKKDKTSKATFNQFETTAPIKHNSFLRVGNYEPILGLTTCTATAPYSGP